MLIKFSSDNPDFSYVINKNPASPPKVVDTRKGYTFGWFLKQEPEEPCSSYCLRFMDAPDEVSFPDYQGQEFEYLSTSKYSSPLILTHGITNFFGKLSESKDVEADHTLEVSAVLVGTTDKVRRHFQYFQGLDWTPLQEGSPYYSVKFSKFCKFTNFLELAEILFLYIAILNEEYVDTGTDGSAKWFKKLAAIDAPYMVRYRFKNEFVRDSVNKFKQIQDLINTSETTKFQFSPYSNHTARVKFLEPYFNGRVFDVGCGEGAYVKKFAKKPQITDYICVDTDQDCVDACQRIAEARAIDNLIAFNGLEGIPAELYGGNVILTEVLEHITAEEAPLFLKKCMEVAGTAGKLILTTTNRDFNLNYSDSESPRRDDHLNEMDERELRSLVDGAGLKIESFIGLGDVVNGKPTTFGVICQ